MKLKLLIVFVVLFNAVSGQVLKSINGENISLYENEKNTLLVFLSPECPLCQNYTLTLNNIYKNYSSKGIKLIGVFLGTYYSTKDFNLYKRKYKVLFPLIIDTKKVLSTKYKAEVTPEVILLNKDKTLAYKGRIDNWAYELSRKRKVITEHDLEMAIKDILAGKKVQNRFTKAIGCYIE